jgi:hypothetical protein
VKRNLSRAFFLVLFLGAAVSCVPEKREAQLAGVAKDWCSVIRASQVIPVYPLTEDLQPGDVFLVQMPVDQQHKAYRARGFLPLDNHIKRLSPTGYAAFYKDSFTLPDGGSAMPGVWLKPGKDGAWTDAPLATFPTYTFSVRAGGGLNIALPVQGVPVALSLLGASAAQGTVTLKNARTYGLDSASLHSDIVAWEKLHRDFLSHYAPRGDKVNYVRVVSRIYLISRVNVSVESSDSFGGEASGGVPKPVDVVVPQPGNDPEKVTLEAYKSNLDKLNQALETLADSGEKVLPGGTVKVVSASARSVSLDETFLRPLVIGYLGFDMAIGPYGVLGPPMPDAGGPRGRGAALGGDLEASSLAGAQYVLRGHRRARRGRRRRVGQAARGARCAERSATRKTGPATCTSRTTAGELYERYCRQRRTNVTRDSFPAVITYWSRLADCETLLDTAIKERKLPLGGHANEDAARAFFEAEQNAAHNAIENLVGKLEPQRPLFRRAVLAGLRV